MRLNPCGLLSLKCKESCCQQQSQQEKHWLVFWCSLATWAFGFNKLCQGTMQSLVSFPMWAAFCRLDFVLIIQEDWQSKKLNLPFPQTSYAFRQPSPLIGTSKCLRVGEYSPVASVLICILFAGKAGTHPLHRADTTDRITYKSSLTLTVKGTTQSFSGI